MFTTKKTNRSNRTRLGLEQFDARIVPAVALTQLDLDGDGAADDIRIVGDKQNSTLTITDDGAGKLHIKLDANSNGKSDPGDIDQDYVFSGNSVVLDIQLKAGKDAFGYVASSPVTAGSRQFGID